jgi:hypothetical protein
MRTQLCGKFRHWLFEALRKECKIRNFSIYELQVFLTNRNKFRCHKHIPCTGKSAGSGSLWLPQGGMLARISVSVPAVFVSTLLIFDTN